MVGVSSRNGGLQAPPWSSVNTEDVMSLGVSQVMGLRGGKASEGL